MSTLQAVWPDLPEGAAPHAGSIAPVMPLRILMVCARYLPLTGGTEQHVHEVGRRMAALGHQVTVLTTDRDGHLPTQETREGMQILRCAATPRQRDWYWSPQIWRVIGQREWDLVHVQGWHTFVAPLAMAAAIRHGLPFVLTFHSGGHSIAARHAMRGLQARLLRPLARRARQLIGVSRFEADHFSRELGIERERFTVIGNGAQMPAPRAQAAGTTSSDQAARIISVGRLERYKGHHRVIEALPLIRARRPGTTLRIIGDGPYEPELHALVAQLGLQDVVQIGAIPPGQRHLMADAMAEASLMTLISDYEAHPVAVMEAISLGTPVLTTDSSGFIELAERGLVEAVPLGADTATLAEAILQRLDTPRQPVQLALPDWDDCTRQLLGSYAHVLGRIT